MPDHDNYAIPPKGKHPTPTMTVAACITWLDQEIEEVQAKERTEPDLMVQLILHGTWLRLAVMKARLEDYSMALLDTYYERDSQ